MEFIALVTAIVNLSCLIVRTVLSLDNTQTGPCVDICYSQPQGTQVFYSYSKQTLYSLRPAFKTALPNDVLFRLRSNNICTVPKTKRGKRGGKRKIKVHTTPRQNLSFIPLNGANTVNKRNLITVKTTDAHADHSKHLKLIHLNTRSCGNKT